MKWPLFEKIINNRLAKREAEVDVDALWAAIEPEVDALNRKKRRRLAWWWFPIGGVLLAAGLAIWLWPGTLINPAVEAFPILLKGKDYAGVASETGDIDETQYAQRNLALIGKVQAEATVTQRNTGVPGGAQAKAQKTTAPVLPPAQGWNNNIANEQLPAGLKSDKAVPTTDAESSLPASLIVTDGALSPVPTISMSVVSSVKNKLSFTEDSTATTPLIGPQPRFRFSVALQGGAGVTQMTRSARSPADESIALLALRDRRETVLEHTQASLLFEIHHRSGFKAGTGLHYTQINERYDYQRSESITIDSVYGPQLLVVNLYNQVDTTYGIVPVEQVTTYTKRYYNHHRMFDIPLLLGYQWTVAPRLRLGAQAGGFLNISMRSTGRVASLPDTALDIREANAYRSRIGWSYYFGLQADYQIGPHIHAYAAPSMRYFPESFTRNIYPLQQDYRLYSLQLGVRYNW